MGEEEVNVLNEDEVEHSSVETPEEEWSECCAPPPSQNVDKDVDSKEHDMTVELSGCRSNIDLSQLNEKTSDEVECSVPLVEDTDGTVNHSSNSDLTSLDFQDVRQDLISASQEAHQLLADLQNSESPQEI